MNHRFCYSRIDAIDPIRPVKLLRSGRSTAYPRTFETAMHPDELLEQLKATATSRKAKNLNIIHSVCRE